MLLHLTTMGGACSSRKGVSETAQHLVKAARPNAFIKDGAQRERLHQASLTLTNKQLQQTVQAGVAFHHAAMEVQYRVAVEELFRDRMIAVSIVLLGMLVARVPMILLTAAWSSRQHSAATVGVSTTTARS